MVRNRKQVIMALLSSEMQPGARRVRGREKRNITLNTKLNRNEYSEVERHCHSLGLDYGEWLRSLIMREVRNDSGNVTELALLGEVTSLRLLLINTLEPLLRGSRRLRSSSKKCFAT